MYHRCGTYASISKQIWKTLNTFPKYVHHILRCRWAIEIGTSPG